MEQPPAARNFQSQSPAKYKKYRENFKTRKQKQDSLSNKYLLLQVNTCIVFTHYGMGIMVIILAQFITCILCVSDIHNAEYFALCLAQQGVSNTQQGQCMISSDASKPIHTSRPEAWPSDSQVTYCCRAH